MRSASPLCTTTVPLALWIRETYYVAVISFQPLQKASDKQMGLVCHVVLKMVGITMHIASGGRFKEHDFDPNSFEPLGSLIGIYSCVITGA